jgi:hypothetical protein
VIATPGRRDRGNSDVDGREKDKGGESKRNERDERDDRGVRGEGRKRADSNHLYDSDR